MPKSNNQLVISLKALFCILLQIEDVVNVSACGKGTTLYISSEDEENSLFFDKESDVAGFISHDWYEIIKTTVEPLVINNEALFSEEKYKLEKEGDDWKDTERSLP